MNRRSIFEDLMENGGVTIEGDTLYGRLDALMHLAKRLNRLCGELRTIYPEYRGVLAINRDMNVSIGFEWNPFDDFKKED